MRVSFGGDGNVLELVAMAAWLCECIKNRTLYTLKGCICWCGSDISIKLLFNSYPRLSMLA